MIAWKNVKENGDENMGKEEWKMSNLGQQISMKP